MVPRPVPVSTTNNKTCKETYVEIHLQMITTQPILFNRCTCPVSQPVHTIRDHQALRNGPVPCPPVPGAIPKRPDLSAVPKHVRASRVVLDPLNGLFELPRTAVRGQHFLVQQPEHSSLAIDYQPSRHSPILNLPCQLNTHRQNRTCQYYHKVHRLLCRPRNLLLPRQLSPLISPIIRQNRNASSLRRA